MSTVTETNGTVNFDHTLTDTRTIWREAVSVVAERAKAKLDAGTNGQPTPVQPPAPTAPLPEAPASVNVHLDLAGRQVQLTLRDSDEGRLLARLDAVLQRFPLVATPTSAQAPAAEGWCRTHGVQMRQNHKDGRTWYSHKTAEGWCKGR